MYSVQGRNWKGSNPNGTTQMDKDLLEELSKAMEDASICGLGQAAPNPIRSVVNYFPQELD